VAKNVFRPLELYQINDRRVVLEAPRLKVEAVVEAEPEVYTGPTVEDLRREADGFKARWEKERSDMMGRAQSEAEKIRKDAEDEAFRRLKEKSDQAERYLLTKEQEATSSMARAEARAAELISEAEGKVTEIEKEAHRLGYAAGQEEGFQAGRAEMDRLVDHLHGIIANMIDKRREILEEAETQLIDLVLLISRKVVKVISENQRNVVINNVVQALRKLKSRGDVAIRVNLTDLDLTTEHIKDFMKMVENVKSITVLEDSTVEKGGCIIETDFGEIDARIASQLREIEEKVLELMPVKVKGEN
jgi:flagellar assembly protein FliH